jgi:GNAT superfamily N-acetyltransferase
MIRGIMKIRAAVADDIPEMHRIRLSVRENKLLDPSCVQPADYVPMMTDRGRGWVAGSDSRIIGFSVGDLSRQNIWALFVDPAYEGRGAGRALHDVMVNWMFSRGVERIWLSTEPGTRAEEFYKIAGWQFVGEERGETRYELSSQFWQSRARRDFRLSKPRSAE